MEQELGLDRVPGSGSVWHSKLDLAGNGTRWSLKATRKHTFNVDDELISEALEAVTGPNGDGSIPLWAIRKSADSPRQEDFVLMRKEDFIDITTGHIELARESKSEARRRLAATPALLREEGE